MKHRNLPLRLARLAVVLCLALPFLAFGVWDALLGLTAPFAPDVTDALPAAGRQNATACLLYGCAHSLSQSLQGSTDGWTPDTAADRAQLNADLTARLEPLRAGGVFSDAQYQVLTGAMADTQALTLERWTLNAGLEQWILQAAPRQEADGMRRVRLQALFTDQGVPVYLDLQNAPQDSGPTLDTLLACAGLDEVTDWQPQTLAGYAGSHGEAWYSAGTQLYARVSYEDNFCFRLVSMTPAEMASFLAEETAPEDTVTAGQ